MKSYIAIDGYLPILETTWPTRSMQDSLSSCMGFPKLASSISLMAALAY